MKKQFCETTVHYEDDIDEIIDATWDELTKTLKKQMNTKFYTHVRIAINTYDDYDDVYIYVADENGNPDVKNIIENLVWGSDAEETDEERILSLFLHNLPMSKKRFKRLFKFLYEKLTPNFVCDNTFFYTKEFLKLNNIAQRRIISFMKKNGGYCDCEIITNVKPKFENLDISL